MQKTTDILKEVEILLLQADLRVNTINGNLESPVTSLDSYSKILALQIELESVHAMATKLENSLLKKINQTLRKQIQEILSEKEKNEPA